MITCSAPMLSKLKTGMAITVLMLVPVVAGATSTKADSSDLVESLPAQIPEILTGGSWSNGNLGGFYRAVVVHSQAENQKPDLSTKTKPDKAGNSPTTAAAKRTAEVFIQWISYENGKTNAKIVKTVSIKEFNEKQLRHAFLAMDTLKDNEMTLLVTSYDETSDKDVSISVKATAPGKYTPAKAAQ